MRKEVEHIIRKIIKEELDKIDNPFKSSKVQNVVYHANFKDVIDPFKKEKYGYFFVGDEGFGKKYLGPEAKIHKAFINIQHPFITNDENLRNVFRNLLANQIDDSGEPKEDWFEERVDDFNMSNPYEREQVFNYAKQNRFDSVIIPEDWDGGRGSMISYAVFDKQQIFEL